MPTTKRERKEQTHEAILQSALGLLRTQGIRASSVMDVMQGAGLTVGGFYGHFESKAHLFTEVLQRPSGTLWNRLLERASRGTPAERMKGVLGVYLSRAHRDTPDEGCILPSAAAEVAREGEPYRSALEKKLQGFVAGLEGVLGGASAANRQRAVATLALMVGALTLSRAVAGTALSDEFLKAARAMGENGLER
ncbi:MAG: TetR/AcrR family transcriptional regulator [Archangium sp.]|nr:TetR/AcrR family transcriptional regulator [Archangium sp.]